MCQETTASHLLSLTTTTARQPTRKPSLSTPCPRLLSSLMSAHPHASATDLCTSQPRDTQANYIGATAPPEPMPTIQHMGWLLHIISIPLLAVLQKMGLFVYTSNPTLMPCSQDATSSARVFSPTTSPFMVLQMTFRRFYGTGTLTEILLPRTLETIQTTH